MLHPNGKGFPSKLSKKTGPFVTELPECRIVLEQLRMLLPKLFPGVD